MDSPKKVYLPPYYIHCSPFRPRSRSANGVLDRAASSTVSVCYITLAAQCLNTSLLHARKRPLVTRWTWRLGTRPAENISMFCSRGSAPRFLNIRNWAEKRPLRAPWNHFYSPALLRSCFRERRSIAARARAPRLTSLNSI